MCLLRLREKDMTHGEFMALSEEQRVAENLAWLERATRDGVLHIDDKDIIEERNHLSLGGPALNFRNNLYGDAV